MLPGTPLEDFSTEALAGILRMDVVFFERYCNLLTLPVDSYCMVTQKFYFLEGTTDCIVDLVLIGQENICFIENKVHSSEGWEQLARYSLALSKYYPNHKKFLRYCTKFQDPKSITDHQFLQITWREIGKLIQKGDANHTLDFKNFLSFHHMADNYTIDLNYLLTMQNLRDTLDMTRFHVEHVKNDFCTVFTHAELVAQTKLRDITLHDRFGYLFKNILNDAESWTELLYSIYFGDMQLCTQIFINKQNTNCLAIVARAKAFDKFDFLEHESGWSILLTKKLADLLNDMESDKAIKLWFYESFLVFAKFIHQTPELNWKIQVSKKITERLQSQVN